MDQMCWVSPADQAGNVDNLISRVERLEELLAQLLSGNVSASQLSDITPNAGVLQNMVATSSNAAGGWITDGTFTGVGISTLGWQMADGNTYPIVQMVDGVLQYGFNQAGGTTGSASTSVWGQDSIASKTLNSTPTSYPLNLTITQTGRYLVGIDAIFHRDSHTGQAWASAWMFTETGAMSSNPIFNALWADDTLSSLLDMRGSSVQLVAVTQAPATFSVNSYRASSGGAVILDVAQCWFYRIDDL
jgi:hypothetical protein